MSIKNPVIIMMMPCSDCRVEDHSTKAAQSYFQDKNVFSEPFPLKFKGRSETLLSVFSMKTPFLLYGTYI